MKYIKTPVRYCDEDWMLFDADDQWIASLDAGEVGPEIATALNAYDDLIAQRDALREACERLISAADEADDELNYQGLVEATELASAALALVGKP